MKVKELINYLESLSEEQKNYTVLVDGYESDMEKLLIRNIKEVKFNITREEHDYMGDCIKDPNGKHNGIVLKRK